MNYQPKPDFSDFSEAQLRRIHEFYLNARIERLEAALQRIAALDGEAAQIARNALKN